MPKMIPMDERAEYESPLEELNAQIIPAANLSFIKTQLAIERRRLTQLQPDPNNYTKFVQEHAAYAGAISAYEHLLQCHADAIESLRVD